MEEEIPDDTHFEEYVDDSDFESLIEFGDQTGIKSQQTIEDVRKCDWGATLHDPLVAITWKERHPQSHKTKPKDNS